MIDESIAWETIKGFALKAKSSGIIYHSLKKEHSYKVLKILDDRLIIQRQEPYQTEELTKDTIIMAIKKINNCGGKIKRRSLIGPTVAEETTLVLFHPQLTWSEDGEYILLKEMK
jgi:hypothetical protein